MKGQWGEAIEVIKEQLAVARHRLNYAADNDMIDSLIFEIKALQHKYNFYIKQCRASLDGEKAEAVL